MKKWLDDLYAILLKRGFITLDNSLKNYDKLDKQIAKNVKSGTVNAGQTDTFSLYDYPSKENDFLLIKCSFNDGKVAMILAMCNTSNRAIRFTKAASPSVDMDISSTEIVISNNTSNDLTYSLFINTL